MTVYAAFDQRVTTPGAWLSDWTKTDLTVTGSNDVIFVLYAKEVSAGDTVTLGENGQSASCVNYIVMAVADEDFVEVAVGRLDADDLVAAVEDPLSAVAVGVLDADALARLDVELVVRRVP